MTLKTLHILFRPKSTGSWQQAAPWWRGWVSGDGVVWVGSRLVLGRTPHPTRHCSVRSCSWRQILATATFYPDLVLVPSSGHRVNTPRLLGDGGPRPHPPVRRRRPPWGPAASSGRCEAGTCYYVSSVATVSAAPCPALVWTLKLSPWSVMKHRTTRHSLNNTLHE